jgi:molybdopterin/thiamine biosynthesis adenylyltransferase
MNYDDGVTSVSNWLSRIHTTNELRKEELSQYSGYGNGLEIKTDIQTSESTLREVTFHLLFPREFPLIFPKLFLAPNSYPEFEGLPHVETNKSVCAFGDEARPNANRPDLVAEELIYKAKRVLEIGLSGEGNSEEINLEFQAYWDQSFLEGDTLSAEVLVVTENPLKEGFKVLSLKPRFNSIKYIVHQNEGCAIRLKTYLESKSIELKEFEGFLLTGITEDVHPPFKWTNKKVMELARAVGTGVSQSFESYLRKASYPKIVLFERTISGQKAFFGWFHKRHSIPSKGFRKESVTPLLSFKNWDSGQPVVRFTPHLYSIERLMNRSAGSFNSSLQRFILVGVGSVGSNLLPLLLSFGSVEFRLIDPQRLRIENLGRHLLGFNSVHQYKTKALENHVLELNPLLKVDTRESSIFDVAQDEPDFINDCDYQFVSLGEANIELWISEQLTKGIITTPTFFLWLEPHLLGGHCIYIHPDDNHYETLFNENLEFKFSVVDMGKSKKLSKKEAGCQSSFTPYSSTNVLTFLGALYPRITNLMRSNIKSSTSFTFRGNISELDSLGVALTEYGGKLSVNELVENPRV